MDSSCFFSKDNSARKRSSSVSCSTACGDGACRDLLGPADKLGSADNFCTGEAFGVVDTSELGEGHDSGVGDSIKSPSDGTILASFPLQAPLPVLVFSPRFARAESLNCTSFVVPTIATIF